MADYRKFDDVCDSDEEPIWDNASVTKKAFKPKALDAMDEAAKNLKNKRCYCYLDFSADAEKLKVYEEEFRAQGLSAPTNNHLGRVVIELDQAGNAPKLCENFRRLCTGEQGTGVNGKDLHYQGRPLDTVLPKYCLQASIPNEKSCWGTLLDDEKLKIPGVNFDRPGLVAVGNHGRNTNSTAFIITLNEAEHLDGYNQIIGRVVQGMDVLRVIERLPTSGKEKSFAEKNSTTWFGGRPIVDVVIESCGEIAPDKVNTSAPEDQDIHPDYPIEHVWKREPDILLMVSEKLRRLGNTFFEKHDNMKALEKYKKARVYLEPLLESGDTRYDILQLDYSIQLNVCQVLMAMGEYKAATAMADNVLLELVGASQDGQLPRDVLTMKAVYRRARARMGMDAMQGNIAQAQEAIEDVRQLLQAVPETSKLAKELEGIGAKAQTMIAA